MLISCPLTKARIPRRSLVDSHAAVTLQSPSTATASEIPRRNPRRSLIPAFAQANTPSPPILQRCPPKSSFFAHFLASIPLLACLGPRTSNKNAQQTHTNTPSRWNQPRNKPPINEQEKEQPGFEEVLLQAMIRAGSLDSTLSDE